MEKIGLIAGRGKLPYLWARAAREKGKEVYAFPLLEEANSFLEEVAEKVVYLKTGYLDTLIKTLQKFGLKKIVMIGKVEKSLLFKGLELDQRMQRLLAGLKILNDDSIMLAIVEELAREGIEVIDQSIYLKELFPKPGLLTKKKPDEQLLKDLHYGFAMAKEIGRLDIGQTVVVKNRAVLAVEAIEGTDEAIKRGGLLGGTGAVVAKVSKPQQDWRFDIPTIGETTLSRLLEIRARGLVIEAGKTFIISQDKIVAEAEKNGLIIMAMS